MINKSRDLNLKPDFCAGEELVVDVSATERAAEKVCFLPGSGGGVNVNVRSSKQSSALTAS